MRRQSLFAPLLLIGIGGVFLARNVFPELPLLDYLARYWPLLLVLWGVLRVAEVAFWAATGKPLPTSGVSGGEWTLVIFICVFGGALHAARGFYDWLPRDRVRIGGLDVFGESYDFEVAQSKAVGKTPRVVIESFRGNARITAADVSEVKVTGHNSIRSLDQSSADRANQDAKLEIEGGGEVATIRTNQDRVGGQQRVSADLEIVVPRGSSIEAHGRYGDFDISGVQGNVEVQSDNAGVRVENIAGWLRVDLKNSDIIRAVGVKGAVDIKGRGRDIELENIDGQVTIDGSYSGNKQFRNLARRVRMNSGQTEVELERLAGEMHITLSNLTGHDIAGPARITSTNKDIELSNYTNGLEISINRGDIELHPAPNTTGKTDARTKSGDIALVLPPGAKVDLDATTDKGEASNEFGAPFRQEWSGKRGGSIRGSNGGPQVQLHSERGAISVRRAGDAEAAPPAPPAPPAAPPVPSSPAPLKRVDQ